MSVNSTPASARGRKDYIRPIPGLWWVGYRPYFLFMIRELTSVFILLFAVRLLTGLCALAEGKGAWDAWVAQGTGSGTMAIGGIISLAFVLYHSITWFQAGAVVTPLKIGEYKVPILFFVLGNLGLVALVTLIIGYFSLGG